MKTNSIRFKITLVIAVVAAMAIFVTRPVFSQETAKKESQKKIVLKVIRDDNGNTTVIDSTFNLSDSVSMDSIQKEIDKVIVLSNDSKHGHVRFHHVPKGFTYNFDMPAPPECSMDMEGLEDMECEGMSPGCDMEDCCGDRMMPGMHQRMMRSGGQGQTLNDLLGNIPMDRVVGYSIKDRKNGC